VRLDDEAITRLSQTGSRPVASIQEFLRELGPQMGVCELMLQRYAKDLEAQIHTEISGCVIASNKRRRAMHDVLMLDGETALPFAELRSVDSEGEPFIADWIAQYGTATWVNTMLEVSLQPMIHLLFAHGIGIEADCANMVLMHRNGLPCRVALKDLPAGLHMASQFSACAGVEPTLLQSNVLAEARGDSSANQVLTQFYSATMLRNFGQLSIFLREYFAWPELQFWQQVANCIYRYQDARPNMALRFASFDLFAETIQVERAVRAKLLGAQQGCQEVRNPLHRFRRDV
jgi:siderophore synthetase component